MKKIIPILILILAVVFFILFRLSLASEYAAERLFYRAMKEHKKILLNPDVSPPIMLSAVESELKNIVEKFPLAQVAKKTYVNLAQVQLKSKKYDAVQSTLDAIVRKYPEDVSIASQAQFLKGRAFEKQQRWDEALKEYTLLRDKYTSTPLGLQVPLYIGNYYSARERYAQANQAYNQAAAFYEKLEQKERGTVLGYMAADFLLQSYINLENYEQSGKVLEDMLNNYPGFIAFAQQLPKIEAIFVRALNNPDKAKEIYRSVIARTDDRDLIEALKVRIKLLEK